MFPNFFLKKIGTSQSSGGWIPVNVSGGGGVGLGAGGPANVLFFLLVWVSVYLCVHVHVCRRTPTEKTWHGGDVT